MTQNAQTEMSSTSQALPFQATMHRPTQQEKTDRAFRAYLDLLDTAEWIRGQVRGQLDIFNLTMRGFRLLEMLHRKGPMRMTEAAEKTQVNRQNLDIIVRRLQREGWVSVQVEKLPPAEIKESHIAKAKRGQQREGRRVAMLQLTSEGEAFIKRMLPRHAKVVKAFMRALDGREQESLSAICRKLRRGDVMKFISELEHED